MLTMLTNQESLDFAKLFIQMGFSEKEIMLAMQIVEVGHDLSVAIQKVFDYRSTLRK